jgi:hypothetical protein
VKDLRKLQRWFALVVEHPSTAGAAIASRNANALVPARSVKAGQVLRPSRRMTAQQQMQVYNGAYLARLVEVMQGDFGAVQHVLGEDAFRELVARYVAAHPSRHPNLNQLGARFAAFVASQRKLPHRAFVAELATLELAMCQAFDAPEFTSLTETEMSEMPADQWPRARLTLNPSVRLCAFCHPVDEFFQAWKEGKPFDVPERAASWLCVFRKDDRVWRQRLAGPAHAVLTALAGGRSLGEALAHAEDAEQVGAWFREFAADGLFSAVRFAGHRARRR